MEQVLADVVVILFLVCVVSAVVFVGPIMTQLSKAVAKRLEGMQQQQPRIVPGDLARLEEAVTSLGERVLRLEEHQQFLERLVEERPRVHSLAEPAESDAAGERAAGTA